MTDYDPGGLAAAANGLLLRGSSVRLIRQWLRDNGTGYSERKFIGTSMFKLIVCSAVANLLFDGYDFGAVYACVQSPDFSKLPDSGVGPRQDKLSRIISKAADKAYEHAAILCCSTYVEEREKLKRKERQLYEVQVDD